MCSASCQPPLPWGPTTTPAALWARLGPLLGAPTERLDRGSDQLRLSGPNICRSPKHNHDHCPYMLEKTNMLFHILKMGKRTNILISFVFLQSGRCYQYLTRPLLCGWVRRATDDRRTLSKEKSRRRDLKALAGKVLWRMSLLGIG